ncbi:sin3 histone deacetylase corepressor complex component SDS3 [Neocloeon triangulifer]|uniref:sin3 histone deacetylase corepressor complex component SDS3 n=1 Tax=Neocloeon triangulifer TaxID=2078957 RepID=UPI00286FA48F|nr:sin3 histone deacetylase corepressor complex component SDS3 [Neocloeon triangulifer]XP_059481745.1 sin3 histone deacetylase corepressor complex component SDS3 [Neocloeon triangulifer]
MNTMWMAHKTKSYSKGGGTRRKDSPQNGSPAHSSYLQDEYDFEFDKYSDDGDDRFLDDRDESDEDTEEASETDMGKTEEYTEIKEQMYQDKLASLKKLVLQLKEGSHPEYVTKLKKLEAAHKERLRLNVIWRDYEIECVERDYIHEKKMAAKECEEKKIELRELLLSELEDKRKIVDSERQSMELTGDSMEVKPVMTRKLRRRPNDPVPIPEKRRKPPPATLNYLLEDKEIESDLRQIVRARPVTGLLPPRKPSMTGNATSYGDAPLPDTRIEDGKLLFERRWYHRGQPVYVEGKDISTYPAIITAIGTESISVKKTLDGAKFKINLFQLVRGTYSVKRRAP